MLVATPYSSLIDSKEKQSEIRKLSDIFEIRNPSKNTWYGDEAIWHCELSIVSRWRSNERNDIAQKFASIKKNGTICNAISFHVLSRYEKIDFCDGVFVGHGAPMTVNDMFENAKKNIEYILSSSFLTGAKPPLILIENNNHLGSDIYDVVTDASFLSQLTYHFNIISCWTLLTPKSPPTINR